MNRTQIPAVKVKTLKVNDTAPIAESELADHAHTLGLSAINILR